MQVSNKKNTCQSNPKRSQHKYKFEILKAYPYKAYQYKNMQMGKQV
jgi:hypothetical protein